MQCGNALLLQSILGNIWQKNFINRLHSMRDASLFAFLSKYLRTIRGRLVKLGQWQRRDDAVSWQLYVIWSFLYALLKKFWALFKRFWTSFYNGLINAGSTEGTKFWGGGVLIDLDRLEQFVKSPLYWIWENLVGQCTAVPSLPPFPQPSSGGSEICTLW